MQYTEPRRNPTPRRWEYRTRFQCRNTVTYWLRYLATEPRDATHHLAGRATCRLFGRHNATCRGRVDHLRRRTA